MKNWKSSALLSTPQGIVIVVGLLILGVEFLIMLVIVSLHNVILMDEVAEEIAAGIIDPILLTLIISPALYFLVFRKIHKSEELYRQMVEKSPDIVYRFSNKRGGIFYSERAAQILGYSLEHLHTHPFLWNESIHHKDASKITKIIRQLEERKNFDIEYRIKNAQGQWLWLHDRSMRIDETADGEFVVEGLAMDITERKQAEEIRARLMEHLDASPDFVGFADATDAHVLYVNRAGRAMVGLGEDEDVTRLKIADIHPAWANQILEEVILPTAVRAGSWQGECAFLHRDGHEIPTSMVLIAHKSASGSVEIFSTTSRDITERKRAEVELTEQLEELRRWHEITSGREKRILVIKHEVNELLAQAGQPPRYPSAELSNAE